jgi:hypothetical protein
MDKRFAMTPKGVKILIIGFLVMVAGFILMAGGGSSDPAVFNYDMFDFRRLVAAPLVILCGIVIEIIAIMGSFTDKGEGPGDKKEK